MRLDGYRAGLNRGRPAWVEALWVGVRAVFFLLPVPLPSSVRAGILRAFGAQVGNGVVIRHGVNISFPWRFSCGDHVWLGEGASFLSLAIIKIGSHVCISQGAFLCTGSHDFHSDGFKLVTKPIEVHSECWIAARAFIGPGVKIETGSLIAACSVVTRSIPPASLVRGNPATITPFSESAEPGSGDSLPSQNAG